MESVKKVVKHFTWVQILFLTCLSASGQGDPFAIPEKFDNYRQHVLQEKIFVHTDKPVYFAGEIMWFKIYDVDATTHKPLDISKVAYAEILDPENKPVLQAKIGLKNGSGSGSFYVPFTIHSGSYKFRTYTNWMKNTSPDFFFEKALKILNTLKTAPEIPTKKGDLYDIQFFPEGGNLVANIETKIGFRVVNQQGQGMNFEGKVVDENSRSIVKFNPLKFGIGNFSFKPEEGHTYKAILNIDNKDVTKELPVIHEQGYVMNLNEERNDSVVISIRERVKMPADADKIMYLYVHTRQQTKIIEKIALINGQNDFKISKGQLGDGISHFTLFNSRQQPVCERLFFKMPDKKLEIEIKSEARQFAPRAKVELGIRTLNSDGTPEPGDLSVAVYKHDSLQDIDPIDIFNYLWLSSDLKGNLESPEYYFTNQDAVGKKAIDNLMLVNGWSRFRWENVLKNEADSAQYLPEYEGHIIDLKITDNKTGKPAGNILTQLFVPGIHFQFYNSTSNSKGLIRFYTRKFYTQGELMVQTGCQTDSSYRFEVSNPFCSNYSSRLVPGFVLSENVKKEIAEHRIDVQVQNIYSAKAIGRIKEPPADTLAFFGKPDLKYFLDAYTRFGTMEEVIREYVEGISLHRKKNNFSVQLVNLHQHLSFEKEPLVLFDGVPVCDFNKVMEFDPLMVKKIEIINQKYYLGDTQYDGILSLSTYKGNYNELKPATNSMTVDYEGLQKQKEFYSPVYETDSQKGNRLPDFRNLLFWSPDSKTDSLGKGRVGFYTSDRIGEYVIVIQGIAPDGNAGIRIVPFKVTESKTGLK